MFEKIRPDQWEGNVFSSIGDEWMLVTVRDGEKTNAMTASWGGFGVIWGRPSAYIFVRPQRHTFSLLEKADRFTLCIPGERYRKALGYCGSRSGRDEDKLAACGLSTCELDGVPAIAESHTVFVCRKLYSQFLREDCFKDVSEIEAHYPQRDYHCMYISEIEALYRRAD